jgi:hypothetical protein
MNAIATQLHQMRVADQVLNGSSISLTNHKKFHSALSPIVAKNLVKGEKQIAFDLELIEGKPTLKLNNRKVVIEKGEAFKQINRIFQYYYNTGQLTPPEPSVQDKKLKDEATKKVVADLEKGANPDLHKQGVKGLQLVDGVLDQARNFLYAIPSVGPDHPIVNNLGYYAGALWSLFAGIEIYEGVQDLKTAKAIEDSEGKRRSITRLVTASLSASGSVAYLTGRVLDNLSFIEAAGAAFNVATGFFGVGTLLSLGSSILGVTRCYRFNERINEYLHDSLLTEEQKLTGALKFLQEQVAVSEVEKRALVLEVDQAFSHLSADERQAILQKKIANLTEVKMTYVKRRTSNRSLYWIQTQIDPILAKIKNSKTKEAGLNEAKILLGKVQKENRIKMGLYLLGTLAAILSLCATLLTLLLTAGIAPLILFAVAGTIYLGLTAYGMASHLFKKEPVK